MEVRYVHMYVQLSDNCIQQAKEASHSVNRRSPKVPIPVFSLHPPKAPILRNLRLLSRPQYPTPVDSPPALHVPAPVAVLVLKSERAGDVTGPDPSLFHLHRANQVIDPTKNDDGAR